MNKVNLELPCGFFTARSIKCPCGCNKDKKTIYRDLDHYTWFSIGIDEMAQALGKKSVTLGWEYAAEELAIKVPNDKYLLLRQGDSEDDREIDFVSVTRLAPEHFYAS